MLREVSGDKVGSANGAWTSVAGYVGDLPAVLGGCLSDASLRRRFARRRISSDCEIKAAHPTQSYQRSDQNHEAHAYQDQGPFAVESVGERPEQHFWDVRAHE